MWSRRPWGPSSTAQPSSSSPAPVQPPAAAVQQLSAQTQTLTISEKKPLSPQSGQIQAIRRPDRGGMLAFRRINLVVNHFPVSFNDKGTIFSLRRQIFSPFSGEISEGNYILFL